MPRISSLVLSPIVSRSYILFWARIMSNTILQVERTPVETRKIFPLVFEHTITTTSSPPTCDADDGAAELEYTRKRAEAKLENTGVCGGLHEPKAARDFLVISNTNA